MLEKVQRRATKLIYNIRNWSYEKRLKYLDMYSLDRRRKRGDLIEAFKILNGFEDVEQDLFFQRSQTNHLRGHRMKLFKKRSVKLCQRSLFSQRVVSEWNNLPPDVIEASSIASFKKKLDDHRDAAEMGVKSVSLT